MALTIQISDRIYERLRLLAQSQGVSLNKLVEEWAAWHLRSSTPRQNSACVPPAGVLSAVWPCWTSSMTRSQAGRTAATARNENAEVDCSDGIVLTRD
jgi:hypothetical protein